MGASPQKGVTKELKLNFSIEIYGQIEKASMKKYGKRKCMSRFVQEAVKKELGL